jgi:transcriptional regulator with XRE-family HTH domain
MATISTFPERLTTARKLRGLKQMELSHKTGLKQAAISQFETGRRMPSLHNLGRLADALEINADYLLGRSQFMEMQNALRNGKKVSALAKTRVVYRVPPPSRSFSE